jgi:hypothetical protein
MAVDAASGNLDAALDLRYELAGALIRPLVPGARAVGDGLMAGKAAKHLAMLGRGLVIQGEPNVVTPPLAAGIASAGRFEPVVATGDDAAAWAATSMFGPYPRLAARAAPTQRGHTEFGVAVFVWQMRFPQGGPFVDRVWGPVADALRAAGLPFVEEARSFVKTGAGPTQDGEWRAATGPITA